MRLCVFVLIKYCAFLAFIITAAAAAAIELCCSAAHPLAAILILSIMSLSVARVIKYTGASEVPLISAGAHAEKGTFVLLKIVETNTNNPVK
jgi:hypothetical protein